jgi:hypothetical protein
MHSILIGQEKRTPMPTGINVASISCILALPECPMAGWRSSGTRSYISCVLCKLPRQERIMLRPKLSFGKVVWNGLPLGKIRESKPDAYFLLGQFVLRKMRNRVLLQWSHIETSADAVLPVTASSSRAKSMEAVMTKPIAHRPSHTFSTSELVQIWCAHKRSSSSRT